MRESVGFQRGVMLFSLVELHLYDRSCEILSDLYDSCILITRSLLEIVLAVTKVSVDVCLLYFDTCRVFLYF